MAEEFEQAGLIQPPDCIGEPALDLGLLLLGQGVDKLRDVAGLDLSDRNQLAAASPASRAAGDLLSLCFQIAGDVNLDSLGEGVKNRQDRSRRYGGRGDRELEMELGPGDLHVNLTGHGFLRG
jgi:hypothetical protein